MPNIMDVAKLAGVSHGTVSNVLKRATNVKLKNVRRVHEAMEALGYRPDPTARTLKVGATSNVAVILPNILDSMYASFFTAASDALTPLGYNVSLHVTAEIASREYEIIQRELGAKSAGILIVTCQPLNTAFFQSVLESETRVVFVERTVPGLECNTIACGNESSINEAVHTLIQEGHRRIGIVLGPNSHSCEQLCERGYHSAMRHVGIDPMDSELIYYTNYNSTSAFKAAMHLLASKPDAILCTSTQLVEGILEALRLGSIGTIPRVVALTEELWTDNRYPNIDIVPRNSLEIGIKAARLLHDNIENGTFFEYKHFVIPNHSLIRSKNEQRPQNIHKDIPTLRVALIEGDTAAALRSLLPDLVKKQGIQVVIDSFPHEELYDFIVKQSRESYYDVFSVDILWLKEFATRGMLLNLSGEMDGDALVSMNIQQELLEDFSYFNENIYGIPLMYCNQLLFYRTDLFEDSTYRRMFLEQHKRELRIPQNWTEFNAVARFFTKEFNPESPTQYGTTLGGRYSCAALCEYLPRLWAGGGDVFDHTGQVILDSPEAVKMLKNYCESFQYASPQSTEHWWHEQVREFTQGKAAMMMMYSSYVSPMMDRNISQVVGKVGFDAVPGQNPVLGGWSLSINARSTRGGDAWEFIKWACGKEMGMPNTVLGNLSACRHVFESNEIYIMYPWVRASLDILPTSKKRTLPASKAHASIQHYEQIIAHAVHQSIIGGAEPNQALRDAAESLRNL